MPSYPHEVFPWYGEDEIDAIEIREGQMKIDEVPGHYNKQDIKDHLSRIERYGAFTLRGRADGRYLQRPAEIIVPQRKQGHLGSFLRSKLVAGVAEERRVQELEVLERERERTDKERLRSEGQRRELQDKLIDIERERADNVERQAREDLAKKEEITANMLSFFKESADRSVADARDSTQTTVQMVTQALEARIATMESERSRLLEKLEDVRDQHRRESSDMRSRYEEKLDDMREQVRKAEDRARSEIDKEERRFKEQLEKAERRYESLEREVDRKNEELRRIELEVAKLEIKSLHSEGDADVKRLKAMVEVAQAAGIDTQEIMRAEMGLEPPPAPEPEEDVMPKWVQNAFNMVGQVAEAQQQIKGLTGQGAPQVAQQGMSPNGAGAPMPPPPPPSPNSAGLPVEEI